MSIPAALTIFQGTEGGKAIVDTLVKAAAFDTLREAVLVSGKLTYQTF
jgi:hypothetical protein